MTQQEQEKPQPFAEWLLTQRNGATHQDLSEALHDLVAAVRDTGKKGTLTLTVEVAMLDKQSAPGVSTQMRIADKVTLKKPEHDRTTSIFWTDAKRGNALTRNDPAMFDFDDLREPTPAVPDTEPLRTAGDKKPTRKTAAKKEKQND